MNNHESSSGRLDFCRYEELIDEQHGDLDRLCLQVRVANAWYKLNAAAGNVSPDECMRARADYEYAKDELMNYDYPGEVPDIVE